MNRKTYTENEIECKSEIDDLLFKEIREKMYLLKKQVFLFPSKENVNEFKNYKTQIMEELGLK